MARTSRDKGRVTHPTDARGTTICYAYEAFDRLTQKTLDCNPGVPANITANTYDQARTGYYNVGALTTLLS